LIRFADTDHQKQIESLYRDIASEPDEMSSELHALYPHLSGSLEIRVFEDLKTVALARDDPQDRIMELVALADIAPERSDELLGLAFAAVGIHDDQERADLAAECEALTTSRVPTRDTLLDLLDLESEDFAEQLARTTPVLPGDLTGLAEELFWIATTDALSPAALSPFLARMSELGHDDRGRSLLADLIDGLELEKLHRLIESLPPNMMTADVCVRIRRRVPSPGMDWDNSTLTRIICEKHADIPEDAAHLLVDWFRRPESPRGNRDPYGESTLAALAPLYARVGRLDEALAMADSIAAHDERARAFADSARYLPEPDRHEALHKALDAARVAPEDKKWAGEMGLFAKWLSTMVGAPGDPQGVISDSQDLGALVAIASQLPDAEAETVWDEAIKQVRQGPAAKDLLALVQNVPPRLLGNILEEILVSRGDADYRAALPILNARFHELGGVVQFKQLGYFLHQGSGKGRSTFLSFLRGVLPILQEAGGDETLAKLRESMAQAGTWWP